MKPKEIKIEGNYDCVADPLRYRSRIERPATLSDCYGTDGPRRTILWINGRPHLLKKGGE